MDPPVHGNWGSVDHKLIPKVPKPLRPTHCQSSTRSVPALVHLCQFTLNHSYDSNETRSAHSLTQAQLYGTHCWLIFLKPLAPKHSSIQVVTVQDLFLSQLLNFSSISNSFSDSCYMLLYCTFILILHARNNSIMQFI